LRFIWLAEDVYDTRRFEKEFGVKHEVGIEEGLRREVAWYRSTDYPSTIFRSYGAGADGRR